MLIGQPLWSVCMYGIQLVRQDLSCFQLPDFSFPISQGLLLVNFSCVQPIAAHFDANFSSTKKVGESAKVVPGEWGSEVLRVLTPPRVNRRQKHHRPGRQLWKLGLERKSSQDTLHLEHQELKDTETLLTNIIPGDKRYLYSTQTTCTISHLLKAAQWPCLTWSLVLWQQDQPVQCQVPSEREQLWPRPFSPWKPDMEYTNLGFENKTRKSYPTLPGVYSMLVLPIHSSLSFQMTL